MVLATSCPEAIHNPHFTGRNWITWLSRLQGTLGKRVTAFRPIVEGGKGKWDPQRPIGQPRTVLPRRPPPRVGLRL